MQRWGVLADGVGCCVVLPGTFLYAIGVVSNAAVPWMIDAEERDLLAAFGRGYAEYRARAPMLVPGLWSKSSGSLIRRNSSSKSMWRDSS